MENLNTKEQIVNFYRDNYEDQFMIPFLRLSLTKLGGLSPNNPVRLTDEQSEDINNILDTPENEFTRETFIRGLNVLTMDQIGYVGW